MTSTPPTTSSFATPNSHRPSRSMRRTLSVLVATIGLVFGLVAAATAQGFDEGVVTDGGLFYGNFDEDVLLFVGETTADICNGEEQPTHEARVFERRDGSTVTKVDGSVQPIYLYSSDLGAPEFIDATCGAMFDGDASTVPVEPFAEGEGTVRMRDEERPDGTLHTVNSTVGSASTADGTTFRLRAWADLVFIDGVPQGDPADFQGLRIAQTGA